MPTVAEIARRFGGEYVKKFGAAMPAEHRRVLDLIARCRTGDLGTTVYHCQTCHREHHIPRSCGNRHCPACQQEKTKAWLQDQLSRLLPCSYFLLTFTVPESVREFVRSHPKECYEALFAASSETIRTLAADPKYVGSRDCGFTGVLHTWGRTMSYHPHVHYIVPGGAVSADGTTWLPSRPNFFIPVKAASAIYRAKFRDAMDAAGLLNQIPASVWQEAWVVDSQAVGDGRRALKYLARYVYRVAISDHRIMSVDDGPTGQGEVTFSYRKSGSRRYRRMPVPAEEFLRRFLQHVLPSGFQKVRHYGFLSSRRRATFELVRWLVTIALGLPFILFSTLDADLPDPTTKSSARCPDCGGELVFQGILPSTRLTVPFLFDTS
jgi:DNA-directed RNA polymerase subunit RPC12/RpoP